MKVLSTNLQIDLIIFSLLNKCDNKWIRAGVLNLHDKRVGLVDMVIRISLDIGVIILMEWRVCPLSKTFVRLK